MKKKDPLYSIGQLADMSNASVKQLRYLDEKGILVPEVRSKETNYRYYSPEQLNQLVIIKTLRDLGFSFENVVDILESQDKNKFTDAIKRQIEVADTEIQDAIFRYERLASYYTQLLKSQALRHFFEPEESGGPTEAPPVIEVVEVPRQTVFYTRNKTSVTSRQLFIDRFFDLQKICAQRKIATFASMMALFHDGYMNQFDRVTEDLETMIPISQDYPLSKEVRMFGGFKGVSAIHRGHYRHMKELYRFMEGWAKKQGILLMSQSLEIYLLGPDMATDPDGYITRVIVPFQGSQL